MSRNGSAKIKKLKFNLDEAIKQIEKLKRKNIIVKFNCVILGLIANVYNHSH